MRPLVWVRITWGDDGHEVLHVDVYGDGVTRGSGDGWCTGRVSWMP